jgi:hypothetical protein
MRSIFFLLHDPGIGRWKQTETRGGPDFTLNRTSSQYARYFRTHGRCCHLSRCVILGLATGVTAILNATGDPLLAPAFHNVAPVEPDSSFVYMRNLVSDRAEEL